MLKKTTKGKKKDKRSLPSRITNDTVAEHREKVLAGGRKHKYPIQYSKHKLVWNTIFISIAGLVTVIVLLYLQLYVWKDTSDLAYRITKILPLPAGSVEGEFVRYSDYLLYNRGNMAVLKTQGQDQAGDKVAFQRQRAMNQAVQDAYVRKLARERGISVDDRRVDEEMDRQQKDAGLSKEAYRSAVKDMIGWSLDEARDGIRASLLRWEVSFAVDEAAANLVKEVEAQLKASKSLTDVAAALGERVQLMPETVVPKTNKDGGLTEAAIRTADGTISGVIKPLGGDGYYFVQPRSRDDSSVTYSYLKIPLTTFKTNFDKLINGKKVTYYVHLDQPAEQKSSEQK